MSLIYLGCAWLIGICLGAQFELPLAYIFIGLIPLPLLFLTREHKKLVILISLCLFAFLGGTFRFQSSVPTIDEDYLQFYNDKRVVEIEGLLYRDPDVRDETTHLNLSAREIRVNNE